MRCGLPEDIKRRPGAEATLPLGMTSDPALWGESNAQRTPLEGVGIAGLQDPARSDFCFPWRPSLSGTHGCGAGLSLGIRDSTVYKHLKISKTRGRNSNIHI